MAAGTRAAKRVMAWAVTLCLAGLMAACGGGTEDADPVVKAAPAALVRVQLPDDHWMGEDGQHVVRNGSDWERVWDANNGIWPAEPAPPLTHIDFKQHMLVGVTSSYGGCSGGINITSAELETTPTGEGWVVTYQLRDEVGGPDVVCTDDMKPVADFILLPTSPAAVRFVELPRPR